jgi:tetratricopeptide (TPR) repeat protein
MRRILVPLLLLAATFASARPLDLPGPDEKWLTLKVDELTFVSNVSASETTKIAHDVLRMREGIGRLTGLRVRSKTPTRIIIFGSERAFAPYRDAMRQQKVVRGLFYAADSNNFIIGKRGGDEGIDRTMYHELTHYFFHNTTDGLPPWAEEGFAEYYSTFRADADSVHIGYPIDDHLDWLRRQLSEGKGEQLLGLRELLEATRDSHEGSRQGAFYAQSWALVHYLMADDARRAQLFDFLRLLVQQKPLEEAFSTAFGKTCAALDKELRKYLRGKSFGYIDYVLSSELAKPNVPKPQPLSRDALLFELGHLLAHATPQEPHAQRFLEEALALNPSHAGAHAHLGRLHHHAGRRQEAEAAYARAMELGSDDPYVYLLAGINASERIKGVIGVAPRDAVLSARKAFERSAELDPDSARAWMGIGSTYVVADDDPAPGIAALEKCLELTPGDTSAGYNLVQLYARANRPQAAKQLAAKVMASGIDASMKKHLQTVIVQMDLVKLLNDMAAHAESGDLARSWRTSTPRPRWSPIPRSSTSCRSCARRSRQRRRHANGAGWASRRRRCGHEDRVM